MMNNIILYSKLAALPDDLKAEVSDFVDFFSNKEEEIEGKEKARIWQWKRHVCYEARLRRAIERLYRIHALMQQNLLDTHTLVWYINGDAELSQNARAAIEADSTILCI